MSVEKASVLVGFDAPLGVPESYWAAVKRNGAAGSGRRLAPRNFAAWLRRLNPDDPFFSPVLKPEEWRVDRPFFQVPKGEGSRRRFEAEMQRAGVESLRRVERHTGAKPVFIAGGVAGAVGSSAIDLWRGLATSRRQVGLWPFDGALEALSHAHRVVVGEIYPRLAYALALGQGGPNARAVLLVPKTDPHARVAFLACLRHPDHWPSALGVRLDNVDLALASEDAFDAFATACGLLRCIMEGSGLSTPEWEDGIAEGGILGSGSVRLDRPPMALGPEGAEAATSKSTLTSGDATASAPLAVETRSNQRCPIPGCEKIFRSSRSGWDAHVGSLSAHPSWRPELRDAEERRARFRMEFREFFQVPGPGQNSMCREVLKESPFLTRPESDWVASNPLAFAIRDAFPVSPGHTLIVPRRVMSTWFDTSSEEKAAILDLLEVVKRQLDVEFHPDGYNIGVNVGEAAGQTVRHLHLHVIPRYKGDVDDPRGGVRHVIPGKGNYLKAGPQ
jgi:diadenosine tetraphosphate (Ap4A) HIT family hydrolase